MKLSHVLLLGFIMIFALAACGGVSTPVATEEATIEATEEMTEEATEEMTEEATATVEATEEMTEEATATVEATEEMTEEATATVEATETAQLPEWATIELVDVNSGDKFTLAQLAEGKTVYVHMMATWCSNCRRSHEGLAESVVPTFTDGDVVFVSIDVQSDIDGSQLDGYRAENNFGWTFAVANNALLSALSSEFGRTVTNPPSTPHFVIYPDGTYTTLQTGISTPDEKIALIKGA